MKYYLYSLTNHKIKEFSLIFLMLSVFPISTLFGAVYYVTVDASLDGIGTRAAPWTLETAATQAIAGDIVYVLAGDYGNKTISFPNSGIAGQPIYFIGCTIFPTGDAIGKTDIVVNFPMSSYNDFLTNDIKNYVSIIPLLDGITREGIGLSIGNRSYIHIQNFVVTRYKSGVQTTVAGVASEHITLKNIIGSDFANLRDTGCGCEVITASCPQKLGYGLEIYGNHHVIEGCIMADASAFNIAVWGSDNTIRNCKTFGTKGTVVDEFDPTDYFIEVGGYNDVIGMRTVVSDCIAVRKDDGVDLCHKGKGMGVKRGQNNTFINCSTTDLDNEGFYVFGLTTTGNVFKNCTTHDDNRDGNALSIREGANKNSFVNCKVNDAGIAVRFKRDGGGHQNLFFNCFFNRPKVHVQVDKYGGCSAWTNCLVYADCETCETKSKLNENIFLNCLFLSAFLESPSFGIFTIDNQEETTDRNQVINSIFYKIPSFRACSNGVSLNNPQNLNYVDRPDCANQGDCCPDFTSVANIIPAHFEVSNSLFDMNGFAESTTIPNFAINQNLETDPLFIDATNDDYHLSVNSPALNSGKNPLPILKNLLSGSIDATIPYFDITDTPRPQDCKYDIGPYEFNSFCSAVMTNTCEDALSAITTLEGSYFSNTTITTNQEVVINSSTTLTAGECLTLLPGFHAPSNAIFLAQIGVCDNAIIPLDKTLPPLRKTLTASDEGPLFQVFPNPLVERTQVSLVLPNEESLQLFLLNNAGQIIQTIIPNEVLRQGYHQLTLNTSGLKSGFYWLQLATEKKVYTKKMVVIN